MTIFVSGMNFQLELNIPSLESRIQHHESLVLIGSCFTEHMTGFLNRAKFSTMQNSHGIVFNPLSVSKALQDVVEQKQYEANDLFYLNEYWHSWFHHSDFSSMDAEDSLQKINSQIQLQHEFLKTARYLIITLGSAFAYKHTEHGFFVSNNHRAPANCFEKILLETSSIQQELNRMHQTLRTFNQELKIIYTISPVRHIRDGIIENNRSKARLLESVHAMKDAYYFPAYELVIDVLRDYRFYDIDMVHPNYQATAFVWEKFVEACIDPACIPLMKKADQLFKAKNHRSKDSRSEAHQKFLAEHHQLCLDLQREFPYLDLREEIKLFSN